MKCLTLLYMQNLIAESNFVKKSIKNFYFTNTEKNDIYT